MVLLHRVENIQPVHHFPVNNTDLQLNSENYSPPENKCLFPFFQLEEKLSLKLKLEPQPAKIKIIKVITLKFLQPKKELI